MNEGVIMVVSGPAGSGKGTICKMLYASGDFCPSVSRTTRAPRPGEVDGVDYSFVSREEFLQLLSEGDFLEHNSYCGQFYGTPKSAAERIIASGKNLLLEIDVNGARQVKEKCPNAVLVMLLPPSFAEQERRLRYRGTETEELIQKRLEQTREELKSLDIYDYIVYNHTGETERAMENIRAIAAAERCSTERRKNAAEDYFTNKN